MTTGPDLPALTSCGGERRPVLDAAGVALRVLCQGEAERLFSLDDAEVGATVGVLAEVVGAAKAQLVAVLAEARSRSLAAGQGWGVVDWARSVAPSLPTRDLLDATEVATAVAAGSSLAAGDRRLGEVVEAVMGAASEDAQARRDGLGVGKAAQICRFHRSVRGMADADGLVGATAHLLDAARGVCGWDERTLAVGIRRTADVARPDGAVERDAQIRRDHRSLVKGPGPVGMSRYTLLLDEEGAAIVDAAVDALAKPRRAEDTGVAHGDGAAAGAAGSVPRCRDDDGRRDPHRRRGTADGVRRPGHPRRPRDER